ncbi:MAG: hypothetical protein SFW35_12355 [Chitinophagales bacterium]|nr:hypothetical protein [Chitinophagales bacterium]
MDKERSNSEVRKELEEIAPHLAAKEKQNPFLVSENYFSQLEEQLLAQIATSPAPPKPDMWQEMRASLAYLGRMLGTGRVLAPALIAIFVLGVSLWLYRMPTPPPQALQLSSVSDAELMAYVQEDLDDIDLTQLDSATLETVATASAFRPAPSALSNEDLDLLIEHIDDQTLEELL